MEEVQLLIVADDPLVRAGLAALLADAAGGRVSDQMSSDGLAELLEEAAGPVAGVDAVIWDLGWEAQETLPEWLDSIGVPVIALLPEDAEAAEVWAAGVQGVLHRDLDAGKLLAAAQAVAQGLTVMDAALAPASYGAEGRAADGRPVEELTPRESEVLQLLAEGLTNKGIAQRLDISDHTVKFHVNAIMGKLGAQSRTEAVVRATRLGLILL